MKEPSLITKLSSSGLNSPSKEAYFPVRAGKAAATVVTAVAATNLVEAEAAQPPPSSGVAPQPQLPVAVAVAPQPPQTVQQQQPPPLVLFSDHKLKKSYYNGPSCPIAKNPITTMRSRHLLYLSITW